MLPVPNNNNTDYLDNNNDFDDYLDKTAADIDDSKNLFLFTFLIILGNSLLLDVILFARVISYMRSNSVRVTVVPTTVAERAKVHNIVTAPTSLLTWLMAVFSMVPPCALLLRRWEDDEAVQQAGYIAAIFNYQLVSTLSYLIIGDDVKLFII